MEGERDRAGRRRRAAILAGIVGVHAGVLVLLVRTGAVVLPPVERVISVFEVAPPAPELPPEPPEPVPDPRARAPEAEAEAAPPAEKAKPVPVVAPEPVETAPPAPVVAAPVADAGAEAAAGAAALPGPGTGAGGVGAGTGAGTAGSGEGGGGGNPVRRARRIQGVIGFEDYPREALRQKRGGSTIAHFDVSAEGRVSNCRIVRSSGHADLDAATCGYILSRFRYAPALDARGRAVGDVMGWRQDWFFGRR